MIVYHYHGKRGETVPGNVEKLVVDPSVERIPEELCYEKTSLREIEFPEGLKVIEDAAFGRCSSLETVTIPASVEVMGYGTFHQCHNVALIILNEGISEIGISTFLGCKITFITIPSTVYVLNWSALNQCESLVQVNLPNGLQKIGQMALQDCKSLISIQIPETVEVIEDQAFCRCYNLVTVEVVPTASILFGDQVFLYCHSLCNLLLPSSCKDLKSNGSIKQHCFQGSAGLIKVFPNGRYVQQMRRRFEKSPVHQLCYYASTTTAEILSQQVRTASSNNEPIVDTLGMTPFHVLFSSSKCRQDLWEVLVEQLPSPEELLLIKDHFGNFAMDYLFAQSAISEWNDLLKVVLQQWIVDRLSNWGCERWRTEITANISNFLAASHEERKVLWSNIRKDLYKYEILASLSVLEMKLWKDSIASATTTRNEESKRRKVDREECRLVSGAPVILPNVSSFLGLSEGPGR